jgi:hypothetical protein
MKILISTIILLQFITTNLFSQRGTIKVVKPTENKSKIDSVASYRQSVALFSTMTLEYPLLAKENNISGTVIISYDIDSNCSFINRKVVSGIGYGCDEAALKSLDQMEIDLKRKNNFPCKSSKNNMTSFRFRLD